jgi:hypothetical protein
MTSVGPNSQGLRNQPRGYYVPIADCRPFLNSYTPGSGAGGSFSVGTFVAVTNATTGTASLALSSLSSIGAGGLLRDLGKTVVSSNRTFRKVQIISKTANINGDGTGAFPFASGYIELLTGLNTSGSANPAPVAFLPGSM